MAAAVTVTTSITAGEPAAPGRRYEHPYFYPVDENSQDRDAIPTWARPAQVAS
jgi:hypothetical protein